MNSRKIELQRSSNVFVAVNSVIENDDKLNNNDNNIYLP